MEWECRKKLLLSHTQGGVNDGTRTHDDWNHNPGLYQLSYAHHNNLVNYYVAISNLELLIVYFLQVLLPTRKYGAPGRTRTCNPRLRRAMLYPVELQAQKTSTYHCFTAVNGRHYDVQVNLRKPILNNTIVSETICKYWSGQRDLNPRPSAPKADALPGCAMPRTDLINHSSRIVECAEGYA